MSTFKIKPLRGGRIPLRHAAHYARQRKAFNCNDTLFGLNLRDMTGVSQLDVFCTFSYGEHWPLTIDLGDVVLVNQDSSSRTTNKQRGFLRTYAWGKLLQRIPADHAVALVQQMLANAHKRVPPPVPGRVELTPLHIPGQAVAAPAPAAPIITPVHTLDDPAFAWLHEQQPVHPPYHIR